MERNKQLFYAVADTIRRHPDRHDQGSWINSLWPEDIRAHGRRAEIHACGTTACLAGHAILHTATPEQIYTARSLMVGSWSDTGFLARLAAVTVSDQPPRESGRYSLVIRRAASELFGLTAEEAETLFDADWRPLDGDVSDALEAIGDGADVSSVSGVKCWSCEEQVATEEEDGRHWCGTCWDDELTRQEEDDQRRQQEEAEEAALDRAEEVRRDRRSDFYGY